MKFAQIFCVIFIALLCISIVNCSAKRREKRTLGAILQLFGFKIVPLNENQNQTRQLLQRRPNRIQTVMPTEKVETTTVMPSVVPVTTDVETFTASGAPGSPLIPTQAPFPNFIPMMPNVPLRIIIDNMNRALTQVPPAAAPDTLPSTTPANFMNLPISQPTPPPVVMTEPAMPTVTAFNGSPVVQISLGSPFRIIMNDMMTAPGSANPTMVPSSVETTPMNVRANLVSSNSMEQSLKPSENIEALPLSSVDDQQFASQTTSQDIQPNKNVQILRSNEATSTFFGQAFPPIFNIFPQFFTPGFTAPQEEIDRNDFSSSQTSKFTERANGQYFNYLTFHR